MVFILFFFLFPKPKYTDFVVENVHGLGNNAWLVDADFMLKMRNSGKFKELLHGRTTILAYQRLDL